MLTLIVAAREFFDDQRQIFINIPEQTICLEHSLISLRRWESNWQKPYLSKTPKTTMEILDYVRCMSVNRELSLETAMSLTKEQTEKIKEYIEAPMTATTFTKDNTPPSREIMTAEIIYWQMTCNQIPFECEKWHLNRLFTLIRVCSIKNQKSKKMGKQDTMKRNRQLNQERRARMQSKG